MNRETADCDRVTRELVRALRGKRSCAELSRRAGYRSNIVQRWEAGTCAPTVTAYLRLHRRFRRNDAKWMERYFHELPAWARGLDPTSTDAVSAFLRALRGKTTVVRIAALSGINRYTVARWLAGSSEPRLPDFLRLVEVMSRRMLDWVATLEDPTDIPSLRDSYHRQQRALEAAYGSPWSHAVLRGLELVDCPRERTAQVAFLAQTLGLGAGRVHEALATLRASGQVRATRSGFVLRDVTRLDTGRDPSRARTLRVSWTRTALERMERGAPGKYGWSVFAVSRADFTRLQDLQMQYVRAMQEIVASSSQSECVGLYCAQLLDLGG